MLKFRTVKCLLISLLIVCLGCEQNVDLDKKNIEPKCLTNQSVCEKSVMSGDFSILFNTDPVITETPFNISLVYRGKYRLKNISAHMEGKNMFMGKIPLFFEPQITKQITQPNEQGLGQVLYVANTMLGSCSEESMRWTIFFNVTLENSESEQVTEKIIVDFDSVKY